MRTSDSNTLEADFGRVLKYLQALADAALELPSLLDLDHVLGTVVNMLVRDFDALLARIWLYDAGRNAFLVRAEAGAARPMPVLQRSEIAVEDVPPWLVEAMRSSEPIVLNDLRNDPRFDPEWLAQEGIEYLAGFPFRESSSGTIRGALIYYAAEPLTTEATEVLAALTAIVAISVNDVERLQREQEISARMAAVQTVTDAALTGMEPDQLIPVILERIRDALHADTSTLLLVSEAEQVLKVAASVGLDQEVTEGVTIPIGKGFAGRIAATRQSWIVEDTKEIEPVSPWLKNELRSVMGVPLLVDDRATGVVHVGTYALRRFTPDDLLLLRLVADRVAAALERARLYEAEREARRRAEEAQERFAFLAEASSVLNSSLDYRTTLSNVARMVVPRLATWCVIDVVDEDGKLERLELAHSDPERTELALEIGRRFPNPGGIDPSLRRVLDTGEPILVSVIDDALLAATARSTEHLEMVRRLELQSYMCVPLLLAGTARGAVTFLTSEPGRHYGPDDLALAQDLANRAAIAVENARLYAQAQDAVQMRDEFLGSVSHDLKNPLAAIKGRAQVLQRRAQKLPPEDRDRMIDGLRNIDNSATRMSQQINDLMDVVRLRAGQPLEMHRESCDLVQILRETLEDHVALTPQNAIRLHTQVPAIIGRFDAARLERVFSNLLTNAVKYSPDGGPIDIDVRQDDTDEGCRATVDVHDHGIGIPEADLPRIFERFHRGSNVAGTIPGTGIGLTGAKQIVEQHGGTIDVTSTLGEGSTFTVTLPCE